MGLQFSQAAHSGKEVGQGPVLDGHASSRGQATSWTSTEAIQPFRWIPAMEGRPPLTPCTEERGADLLVPDSCLSPHAGDRGSVHETVHRQDSGLGSDPSLADNHTKALGTEDLGPPKSCVKTGLTESGLPGLVKD